MSDEELSQEELAAQWAATLDDEEESAPEAPAAAGAATASPAMPST